MVAVLTAMMTKTMTTVSGANRYDDGNIHDDGSGADRYDDEDMRFAMHKCCCLLLQVLLHRVEHRLHELVNLAARRDDGAKTAHVCTWRRHPKITLRLVELLQRLLDAVQFLRGRIDDETGHVLHQRVIQPTLERRLDGGEFRYHPSREPLAGGHQFLIHLIHGGLTRRVLTRRGLLRRGFFFRLWELLLELLQLLYFLVDIQAQHIQQTQKLGMEVLGPKVQI